MTAIVVIVALAAYLAFGMAVGAFLRAGQGGQPD